MGYPGQIKSLTYLQKYIYSNRCMLSFSNNLKSYAELNATRI